jgi:hypothetical protein
VDWDFTVARASTWTALPASEVLFDVEELVLPTLLDTDDPPPPWLDVGLTVESTDRRRFSLQVRLLDDFVRHSAYALHSERRYFEPLAGFDYADSLYLAPWDEPVVLVEAEMFGWPLIERLLFSPAAIRKRILLPCDFSAQEQQVLAGLDDCYSQEEAVRHAVDLLQQRFGMPLRLDIEEINEALRLMRAGTFLEDVALLLTMHPDVFSSDAQGVIEERWREADHPF